MATEMIMSLSPKEYVLVGLTATLVPISLVELAAVTKMRGFLPQVEDDPAMPHASDLLAGVACALVITVLRRYFADALQPVGRLVLAPKKQTKDRLLRFGTVLFKFMYFIFATAVGYYVLKDQEWLPPVLGGTGDIANAFKTLEAPSAAIKAYYMLQTGYHLQSLLYMVFLSPIRNDFIEMLLHHLVTLILIVSSYLANFTSIGALITFIHDIGDVSAYVTKSVVDSGNIPVVVVFYITLLANWGFFRLYVFPFEVIKSIVYTLPAVNPDAMNMFVYPCIALLCMLVLLHAYWYSLLLVMGYELIFKGNSEDIQEQCHDSDFEEVLEEPVMAADAKPKLD